MGKKRCSWEVNLFVFNISWNWDGLCLRKSGEFITNIGIKNMVSFIYWNVKICEAIYGVIVQVSLYEVVISVMCFCDSSHFPFIC